MTILNIALISFLFVFISSAILSSFKKNSTLLVEKPIENYLLAGRSLHKSSVISLLTSTSFGLNPLFFQIWLGYTVGSWGLITQGAWALGYIFFSKDSRSVISNNSLHDFLGQRFRNIKILSSICSLLGIMFMIAFEARVGESSIKDLMTLSNSYSASYIQTVTLWLIVCIAVGSLFYTLIGGLHGNANADLLLNIVKFFAVTYLAFLLIFKLYNTQFFTSSSFFPSITTMKNNLGWWGLATNVIFSSLWQFVDNNAWQNIISGSQSGAESAKQSLKWSGFIAFVAPGVIGTLLGISLLQAINVTQDNVFSTIVHISPLPNSITIFALFIVIIAGIMSLMDGLFLTSAYTLVIDIIFPNKKLSEVDEEDRKSETILLGVRASLIVLAFVSVFGIKWFCDYLGLTQFDYIYIMIISQLSLFGNTFIGLRTTRTALLPQWIPIVTSLSIGFCAVIFGSLNNVPWLVEGAGTFTILTSFFIALLTTKKN